MIAGIRIIFLLIVAQSGLLAGVRIDNETLQKLAKNGDIEAQIEVAFRVQAGHIVPFDNKLIHDSFKKGIEQKIPRAYAGMSLCYTYGIHVQNNDRTAFAYLKTAKDLKDPFGTYRYGDYLIGGWGGVRDPVKGRQFIEEAVKLGCLQAEVYIIELNLPKPPPDEALQAQLDRLLTISEKRGETAASMAAYVLGAYYLRGTTPKNIRLAVKYFNLSADQHHASAMLQMADLALRGKTGKSKALKQKKIESANWLRKAITLRNNNSARVKLANRLRRDKSLCNENESWYQYLLDAHNSGYQDASIALAKVNYHAAGYNFRDLDWGKTAFYYESYLNHYLNEIGPRWSSSNRCVCVHALCELYFKGGLGLPRDYKKCLETAKPTLGYCEMAAAYSGRVLLHPDAPMGKKRQYFINGYACMLKAQQRGYAISKETLFMMRSRHNMTRVEVAAATKLFDSGFPKNNTNLTP